MGTAIAAAARGRSSNATADKEYEAAFARAYDAYHTKIFAFVYSRVHDVELARDIVSEVFEKAYVKGRNVREPGAYGAWLFVVARNLIAGHYRRLAREYNAEGKVKDSLRFISDPVSDPEQSALLDERIGNLTRHVRTLTARDQELISLKFDAELTHAEIAKVLGMTTLNARVTLFRALRRLRTRMLRDENAPAAA